MKDCVNIVIYGKKYIKDVDVEKLERIAFLQASLDKFKAQGRLTYTYYEDAETSLDDCNIMLCLGGDGTILDTLSIIKNRDIRLLGINIGNLGFLSGVDRDELDLVVEKLLEEDYELEERCVLTCKGSGIDFPFALNEFSILKCDTDSLIAVEVYVNGSLLNKYYGDGLIMASATGSTAYSLSCGGPILVPQMEAMLVTPVASHTLTVRPVVLPLDATIRVVVDKEDGFKFCADSFIYRLEGRFELEISKADFKIKTIRLKGQDFFTSLRQKLMWGLDGRRK